MSRYAYTDQDPALFTVWWLNEDKDADMDCGSFTTQAEAEAALPAILAELIDQCGDDEQEAGIRAGSFHLEFPETADGERGETEPIDWPGATS
jgi:hypothetical protein